MPRSKADVISEMVDSGLFSDDEIRSAAKGTSGSAAVDQSGVKQSISRAAHLGLPLIGGTLGATMTSPAVFTGAPIVAGALGAGAGEAGANLLDRFMGIKGKLKPLEAVRETGENLQSGALQELVPRAVMEGGGVIVNATRKTIAPQLERGAVGQGMRALGFTKRFLNTEGKLAGARSATKTLLEEGAIPSFANAETMHAGLNDKALDAGQEIGDYLASRGAGFNPDSAIKKINALRPPYRGGEYEPIHSVIDTAIQTVKAHGSGPLSFQEANDVKTLFQSLAYELKADKGGLRKGIAGAYRQALEDALQMPTAEMDFVHSPQTTSGAGQIAGGSAAQPGLPLKSMAIPESGLAQIRRPLSPIGHQEIALNVPQKFQEAINPEVIPPAPGASLGSTPSQGSPPTVEMRLSRPDPAAFERFARARKVYGASENGKEALMNRISSELGNKQLGLRSTALLAGGNPLMAIANTLYDKYGAATSANILHNLAKPAEATQSVAMKASIAALVNVLSRRRSNAK